MEYQPVFLVDPFDRHQFEQEIDTLDDNTLWPALTFNMPTLVFSSAIVFGHA